jgi:hypothetical protein
MGAVERERHAAIVTRATDASFGHRAAGDAGTAASPVQQSAANAGAALLDDAGDELATPAAPRAAGQPPAAG